MEPLRHALQLPTCISTRLATFIYITTVHTNIPQDHQDRTVWLWEQIAARYKDNAWVAGYNPLNEPCDPEHVRLPAFYDRLEPAIRKVDPNHMLWLDGNTFAMEWRGFNKVLPNCVYAMHDYSGHGFPTGQPWKGTEEQKTNLEKAYLRKALFMRQYKTPICEFLHLTS